MCIENTYSTKVEKEQGRVGLIWVEDKHAAVEHMLVGNTTVALSNNARSVPCT